MHPHPPAPTHTHTWTHPKPKSMRITLWPLQALRCIEVPKAGNEPSGAHITIIFFFFDPFIQHIGCICSGEKSNLPDERSFCCRNWKIYNECGRGLQDRYRMILRLVLLPWTFLCTRQDCVGILGLLPEKMKNDLMTMNNSNCLWVWFWVGFFVLM